MVGEKDYLRKKMNAMGVPETELPFLRDANAKYGESELSECHADMRAYMKLCPDSPSTGVFSKVCQ
jgi:hypothetical protein